MRNPRIYSADPTLASYAACLKNIRFEHDPADRQDVFERAMEGNLRNISMFQDRKTYRVRLYIGGAVRTVGITTVLEDAARFADMAVLFFWPYRIRRGHPPGISCMNFTVEQAEHDLAHNEYAKQILDSILDHLIAFGHLPDPVKVNKEREAARKERDRRRTTRGELLQCTAEIQAEIIRASEAFKKEIEPLKKEIEQLRQEISAMRLQTPIMPNIFPSTPSFPIEGPSTPTLTPGHGSHCACPTCVPPTMC